MNNLRKHIYFASDFHLGVDTTDQSSKEREQKIIRWLDSIEPSCEALYLLGDVFDYWFEYKKVIPKGHVRFLGRLAQFVESGIPVHLFTGNHDMWLSSYLEEEIGLTLYKNPIEINLHSKKFILGHGDGLGPGDRGYKFIKKIFRSPINQWLFARLHPNLGISMMQFFSGKSRAYDKDDKNFSHPEKEWLVQYCEAEIEKKEIDFFIFGHRHLPIDYTLSNKKSRYINLGDMMSFNSYAVLEQGKLILTSYENPSLQIFGN